MGENEADKILNEVTQLLMEKGCTINRPAMVELAIYIVEREKTALNQLIPKPLNKEKMI